MFRILMAPGFEMSPANPDFPQALLDGLITARDLTGSNYITLWIRHGETEFKSNLIVTAYPEAWLKEYTEKNYSQVDPTLWKAFGGTGAVVFDHENPKDDEPLDLARDALAAGIGRFSVGLPTQVDKHIQSSTTFATDADLSSGSATAASTLARCREQAHFLTHAVVERYLRTERPQVNLTSREKEVLSWGAQGKSDAETGEIMGLSRWTVVGHVQSAKAKLRVNNKAAAIAKAIELHLLEDLNL